MPARVTHKSFDVHTGAIHVTVEDDLGARSVHTIHVLEPDGSEADVAAAIAAALQQADARAARLRAAFEKHGWTG
jgi:ribosomal protein L14